MKKSKEITINKNNQYGAEILCIGSEILLGNIVNTNSQWIAEQLAILGVPHFRQTVIGDNPERLKEAILEASNRSEILITTGGLGPTPDDITTKVIADTFKTPLYKIFPNIEIILFNLFETLKDIELFIKDLI